MVRMLALASIVVAIGCSKSAANQDTTGSAPPSGDLAAPTPHGAGIGAAGADRGMAVGGAPGGANPGADPHRLQPDEGTLAVQPPADVKSGAEAIAKITVTPGKGFHVSQTYPIKLTITPPTGVTLAKTEMTSGGRDSLKGDADTLTEQELTFGVKLTAAQPGSYTINGSFKFGVCDHDMCLQKVEPIAIAVAAK